MKNIPLQINYQACTIEELPPTEQELVCAAKEATYTSYSPYSHFSVGAALQLSNGVIVSGSNQENAAFGAGTCAERCAMFYANARYPKEHIQTIAIAARGVDGTFLETPISPCGVCRQALIEAQTRGKAPIKVLLYGEREIYVLNSISDLLPFQFDEIV